MAILSTADQWSVHPQNDPLTVRLARPVVRLVIWWSVHETDQSSSLPVFTELTYGHSAGHPVVI